MHTPYLRSTLSARDRAWLEATFARNRARFGGLRMDGTDTAPAAVADGPADAPAGVSGDSEPAAPVMGPNGYPLDTKPADMTADARAAYYQHELRRAQDHNKANAKRIKELEPAQAQIRALEEASRTEAEKAAVKAREDGEKAGREAADAAAVDKFAPRLVGAEFRAQLAGRLTAEQIATLVAGLNVRGFLTDDGEPDAEKVAAFVAAIPATARPGALPAARVDLGAGKRDAAKPSGLQAGAELFAARHGKNKPPPA